MRCVPSIGVLGILLAFFVACAPAAPAAPTAPPPTPVPPTTAPAPKPAPTVTAAPIAPPKAATAPTSAPAPTSLAVAPSKPTPALDPAISPAADVKVAVIGGSTGAAGFYIGTAHNYFMSQGINLELMNFQSGVQMVPPLAAGQIQAATISPVPAMFNALNQGIKFKVTVDTGSTPPGRGFQALVVRPDLIASGKVKEYKDLKGLKIAVPGRGVSNEITLDKALNMGGLKLTDVEIVVLSYGDMQAALSNKSIDAAMSTEPFITQGVEQKLFVRWKGGDEIYPNHAIGVLALGENFAKTEAAKRLVLGYVRGVRDFNDALIKKINKSAVVKILTDNTSLKDPVLWDKMVPSGVNPDGYVNVESLNENLQWFVDQGLVKTKPDLKAVVDNSFADYVIQKLGKYGS